MKVTAVRSFVHYGVYKKGDTFEVSDGNAESLIKRQLVKKADESSAENAPPEPAYAVEKAAVKKTRKTKKADA